jgi:hypothetical protein
MATQIASKHLTNRRFFGLFLLGVSLLVAVGCNSGGGSKPSGFGAVTGHVRLSESMATSGVPVAGAQVHISGGDFDTTAQTDTNGIYLVDEVPAGTVTLWASSGSCLTSPQSQVTIRKADTVGVDLLLPSQLDTDTIPLPGSGAVRMEIVPGGGRAVLLYDSTASAPGHPAIVTVDLATGVSQKTEFTDIAEAYDLRLAGSNIALFNFRSSAGFGVRFVSLSSMTAAAGDALYSTNPSGFAGHLTLDNSFEHVFVAHAVRQDANFIGKVFAISLADRKVLDADNDSTDGDAAFDTLLVRQSLGWAYSIAFDDSRHEILVGNRDSSFVIAIDWAKWGTFDRTAHLTAPIPGVRKVNLEAQVSQFRAWFLDFAGGVGIAARPQTTDMIRFESGANEASVSLNETSVQMTSDRHFLTVVPSRRSWFTLFEDVTAPVAERQTAVEERSWSTLQRISRFESNRFVLPSRGIPRAFAVDATNQKLYVAYSNRPILEVFCLP